MQALCVAAPRNPILQLSMRQALTTIALSAAQFTSNAPGDGVVPHHERHGKARQDWLAQSGTLTFAPGETKTSPSKSRATA